MRKTFMSKSVPYIKYNNCCWIISRELIERFDIPQGMNVNDWQASFLLKLNYLESKKRCDN